MADDGAARSYKTPPPWNLKTVRYQEYLQTFTVHCVVNSIPEDKRGGLLYLALPHDKQATVRRNCAANGIELLDATVDNISAYMTLTTDVADKSQLALRNAMYTCKFNGKDFHVFLDKWTGYHELAMAVDPAMDENTSIWLFINSLPLRLADMVRLDPEGQHSALDEPARPAARHLCPLPGGG